MSLAEILDDMALVPAIHKPKPTLMVYFEDDQACEVFKLITRRDFLKALEDTHGVNIKPMPLGVGCSSLALLPSKDSYFETVVLVVDADGARPRTIPKNLVELPGGVGHDGKALSPERTLVAYVRALVSDPKEKHPLAWADSRLRRYSQENLEANLLVGVPDHLDRKAAKAWWIEKKAHLEAWGLYEIWAKENALAISAYEEELTASVKAAAKATRSQAAAVKYGVHR